jgi:flagellin
LVKKYQRLDYEEDFAGREKLDSMRDLMSADSSIRDVDMVKEYVDFVKNKLNLEAGMAMLAQGNLNSKNIISLLK